MVRCIILAALLFFSPSVAGPESPARIGRVTTPGATAASQPSTIPAEAVSTAGELILVELPCLVGEVYEFPAHVEEFSLGFPLYEVRSVSVEWSGSIRTGVLDCYGSYSTGAGGQLRLSFDPESYVGAAFSVTFAPPLSSHSFDRVNIIALPPGRTFDFLLDGSGAMRASFSRLLQECRWTIPPRAFLEQVRLRITAQRMHDKESDGDVDLDDVAFLHSCFQGPEVSSAPTCSIFDSDRDDDVDLHDVASFSFSFTSQRGYLPGCGDGVLGSDEECDDSNIVDGDGCSSICRIETHPVCTPGDCFQPSPVPCCNNAVCCKAVCLSDPYCCIEQWDTDCVDEAHELCAP